MSKMQKLLAMIRAQRAAIALGMNVSDADRMRALETLIFRVHFGSNRVGRTPLGADRLRQALALLRPDVPTLSNSDLAEFCRRIVEKDDAGHRFDA